MSAAALGHRSLSMLWLEPHRIHAGGTTRSLSGLPTATQLAQSLSSLPSGPTSWIVEDLWVPAVLLRDLVEIPSNTEARETFFRWKYTQAMALEEPQSVQALDLGEGLWLMAGLPQAIRDEWLATALKLGRPIHSLVPRWLWIYNRLAPEREYPGLLLSLCPHPEGGYTGTLAGWGRSLTLLRQWSDPASPEAWISERLSPTVAYLQREGRSPQELWIWGPEEWPHCQVPSRIIPPEIPGQEAV